MQTVKQEPVQLYVEKDFNVNVHATGQKFGLHWHTFYEVEFIHAGSSMQIINGYQYHQMPGFLSIMTPSDFHQIESDKGCTLQYKKFVFSRNFLSSALCDLLDERSRPCIIQISEARQADFHAWFDKIGRINRQPQTLLNRLSLKNLAECICINALRLDSLFGDSAEQSSPTPICRDESIHQIAKYVQQHFSEPIKVSDVAALLHQGDNYFSHWFTREFGCSFSEYLKIYRLKTVAKRLISTQSPIVEIAKQCGFETITFFNRAFRETYHLTPTEFRKQYLRKEHS